MKIIDTHAHLDHIENVDDALVQAAAMQVSDVVAVGVDLKANQLNLAIQQRTAAPRIHVALGIHPGNIIPEEVDATLQFIREHIHQAIAIGETGLDYWYKWVRKDEAKKAEQRMVFERQLAIAKEFALPIVIHSRGAWKDCLAMTKAAGIKKALFHWYSGPVDILREVIAAGYYVSAGPSLAYSPQSREAIAQAPIERTLMETDSPVFFQEPDGEGFKATPKDVWRSLEAYTRLMNMTAEQALPVLNQNAKDFFTIHQNGS